MPQFDPIAGARVKRIILLTIVLDTNIIISALFFGGKPPQILELVINGAVVLATSDQLLQELAGVLKTKKIQLSQETISEIIHELCAMARVVSPTQRISRVERDPDDSRILECAVTAAADYIVSGDDDLIALKEFQRIGIVTATQFLHQWGNIKEWHRRRSPKLQ